MCVRKHRHMPTHEYFQPYVPCNAIFLAIIRINPSKHLCPARKLYFSSCVVNDINWYEIVMSQMAGNGSFDPHPSIKYSPFTSSTSFMLWSQGKNVTCCNSGCEKKCQNSFCTIDLTMLMLLSVWHLSLMSSNLFDLVVALNIAPFKKCSKHFWPH